MNVDAKSDPKVELGDATKTLNAYQVFFEEAADGMFITNQKRRFLKANRQWLAMTGYSLQDLTDLTYPQMIPPEDLVQQPLLAHILQQGQIAAKERLLLRKDGSRFYAEIRSTRIADGNILSVARDITKRKQEQAAAEERTRELAALQAVGLIVSSSLALDQVCKAALQGMITAVHPDLAYLFLRDGDKLLLQEVAPQEARLRLGTVPEHRVGECMCGLTVQEEKPLYSKDIHRDSRCTWDECKDAGIQSFATLPLRSGQEIIGVIGLASLTERDFEIQSGFLETLAYQVSLALANARNYELARRELAEREKAEQSLGRSESKYRQLIETTGTGYVILNDQGRVTDANQEYIRLTGHQGLQDIIGRSVLEWTAPYDHQRNDLEVEKCLRQGSVRNLVLDYLAPSGRIIPIEINATIIHSTDSLQILSLCRDISERRLAGKKLQQEINFSQILLDSLPGLFYLFDDAGRFLRWNTNFEKVSGYSPVELANMAPWDFFQGGDQEIMKKAVKDVFQKGVSTAEAVFLAKDRTATPYFFTGRRFTFEGRLCLTGMGIDISERKQAETALLDSEKKARAIFERSPVGIILLDNQSTVIDCNEHFAAIFEVPRQRYLGIKLLDHLPDGPVRHRLLETMSGEGIHRFEDQHTSIFSGKQVFLSIISERVAPDLLIVAMTDITEQKEAALVQEKLQEQLLQAQKMESVGRLAGGVAHDFNNMLTAILGHAELAKAHCKPSEPIYADLKVIEHAAHRSADLVRQLLAFARKQTVAPKILDLNDCVAGLLKMLVRLIGEDIDLVWKPDTEIWPIKIDPSQIDQLLANLCVNARDAIKNVGKITIGTQNKTIDADYCRLHPTCSPGEYVMLSVRDNGSGIEKDILEHIFEPFFTTKEVGKGTGLGLSTVYGIAKQNKCLIELDTEIGKGTNFKIYLPRFSAAITEPQAQPKIAIPWGRGQTVLLVEDEEVILNVGKAMLTRLGYKVLPAESPRAAMRAAEAHVEEIQLLITDVIMPEMNGRDLAKILTSIMPRLKCLFTSGYSADIIAVHGVLDEKIEFLQKPFSFQQLAVKVFEVLQE
jgi:PAS domain S-box-containing protein